MTHFDYIIIGSGAGGGTIAHELAKAGKRILILERGGFVPQEDANSDPAAVFGGRYTSKDTWLINGKPEQPQSHYNIGGATKFFGAALFRLRPSDFGELLHEDGFSPAWPISYDDLEPYYSAAEYMYQVHGRHGEDFTEGDWSQQYPHPPVPHEPVIQQLSDDLTAAGYHPFHAPSGVLLQQGGACTRCNRCDGFPCKVAGKADAETIAIAPIEELPNVTIMTGAEVDEIVVRNGRAVGVWVKAGGRTDPRHDWYSADNVILAAGAANTAKILLASGLGGDAVGRNYMFHNSRAVIAVGEQPNPTVFQKTLAVHDFLPLGTIQMTGKSSGQAMRDEDKLARLCPEWTLDKIAAHALDFWLTTEDLPLPGNRITLAPDGNIRLDYTHTNERESVELYKLLRVALHKAGHRYLFTNMQIPLTGVAHQAGTARMGTDPATSVTDPDGKVHGLDNLYIADASLFPSIGAVNPALTVMALALRQADHLLNGR
jgi:choline dehydrogenase-like flavoprotein